MADNRPVHREKDITTSGGAGRRGSGQGTGPVGSRPSGNQTVRPGGSGSSGGGRKGVNRAAVAGGVGLPVIIIALLVNLMGGGLGGGSGTQVATTQGSGSYSAPSQSSSSSSSVGGSAPSLTGSSAAAAMSSAELQSLFSTFGVSPAWTDETAAEEAVSAETPAVTTVASGAREKYTKLLGSGKDTVTIMLYLCGTDLESKNSMATSDLQEMVSAGIGENINLIVYTGGCAQWRTSAISSKVNQVWQVTDQGIRCLVKDDGNKRMTDPATLSAFIRWCGKNFPASRNELILWDHGGGSVSGYGYDEKNKASGSMSLAGIDKALTDGGVTFDFVGFDACLMATAETALMLDSHADYMIASEETEPGTGWYYTDWLKALTKNTSMPTTQIGKNIIDSFTDVSARYCRGQKTTLSIVDLAEFSATVPAALKNFSSSLTAQIKDQDYQGISNARRSTREFAQSSRIDQIDLVHFCQNLGTSEASALAKAVRGAVKYNRTSSDITNAYGVSIFFPYRNASYVDSACNTYSAIGMDESYSAAIRAFAKIETGGQAAHGGYSSAFGSLSGASGYDSSEMIGTLLGSFLGGDFSSMMGLDRSNTAFLSDDTLSDAETEEIIADAWFDDSALVWEQDASGNVTMTLPEAQWKLVHDLNLNLFMDDGEGYIDLGLDNAFDFTDDGKLVADTSGSWIFIEDHLVAYYHTDTVGTQDDYTITGYVPVRINGDRAELLLTFTSDTPHGFVSGVRFIYPDGETETVAKASEALQDGDVIDFLCDYYDYSGNYQDSYCLGEPLTVDGELTVADGYVTSGSLVMSYCFTDLFDQNYWTESVELG